MPSKNEVKMDMKQEMLNGTANKAVVTPWNHAVTTNRKKRYSITSQASSEASISSPTTETFADGSSTAFSISQRALSPAKSVLDDTDHVTPWVQLSTAVQNGDTHAYRSPVFEPYPERDNTGTTTNERPLSPTSDEEEEVAKPDLQPRRSLRRMPRSKRIEHIKGELSSESLSSKSSQQAHEPAEQNQTSATASVEAPASVTSSAGRKRGTYPLQAASLGSITDEAPRSVHNESQAEGPAHAQKPNGYISQHEMTVQPADQRASNLPASPPDSENEAESVPALSQRPQNTQLAKKAPARRRRYPLQAPASRANLQQAPTPPSSPERESNQATKQEDNRTQRVNGAIASRGSSRSRYPLQAAQPTPAPEQHRADSEAREPSIQPRVSSRSPADESSSAQEQKPSIKLRRRGYPLQAAARQSPLRPQSPEAPTKPTAKIPESDPQPTILQGRRSTSRSSRQAYPLQSPVSTVNLKDTPASKNQADRSTSADRAPSPGAHRKGHPLQLAAPIADLNTPVPLYLLEEQNAPIDEEEQFVAPKPFRRSGYPLQTAAEPPRRRPTLQSTLSKSGSDDITMRATSRLNDHAMELENAKKVPHAQIYPLQHNPSMPALQQDGHSDEVTFQVTSPGESTPQAEDAEHVAQIELLQPQPVRPSLDVSSQREQELAVKVLKQWRRQTYPLQSSDGAKHIPFFTRAPTPQPVGMESGTTKHHEGPIHLPKNIKAVKDSDPPLQGRTIVVCLDGTGDKFDDDNSNIVHLISALKKDDPRQVSYYQAGIGTYAQNGLSSGFEAALDMAVGSGLGLHVRDAYHFLMHSYKEGDRICIFGFSRGAYTARCLAGMIHKVGLLPPRNIQQIPFAYEFYKSDTPQGWQQSEDFKRTFSIDVSVYFLGCFDSVASVGFIPRQLPLSSTPTNKARYFRHAMALDERRAKFKICRHTTKTWEEIEKPNTPADAVAHSAEVKVEQFLPNVKSQDDHPPNAHKKGYDPHAKFGKLHHPNVTDTEYEELSHNSDEYDTDVHEVWFTGCHSDVGGGAVANTERHKLAQIPLRWMIRQAFECDTGIIFKTKVLAEFGLDVHTLWPKYESLPVPSHGPPPSFLEKYDEQLPPRSIRKNKLVPINKRENGEDFYHLKSHADEDWTPEQVEDYYDAMCDINDMLEKAPNWWILEFYPVQYKIPVAPGEAIIRTGMNLGRYRGVEDVRPKVHWTVLHRMQQKGYKIPVRTAKHVSWEIVV